MENITVETSTGKTVELRAIRAREQMNADSCSKGDPVKVGYYRTAAAIVKIDDRAFVPAQSDMDLEERIDLLTGAEIDELAVAIQLNLHAGIAKLKNSSSAPSPES